MNDADLISAYDYDLPDELIATVPAARRDQSRLLVVDREAETIAHHQFSDLPSLLRPHDLLVMNNTRVVPAKLNGRRVSTGGKWEGLYLRDDEHGSWRIIGKTRGKLLPGEEIVLQSANSGSNAELRLKLIEKGTGGEWIVKPQSNESTIELLQQFGTMPLPHYMQREAEQADFDRYQTTYAERPGAVAAPTAGLHFTPEVFEECQRRGIERSMVTLHVGLGTFRPVKVDRLDEHEMHYEWCELPVETATQIQATQREGGRIVAVGTTSVRTLEAAAACGALQPWQGETNLFIRPPYQFQVVDALLTNFHLPKSTLLVLVSTFANRELILRAYAEAIAQRYRFFSYGDAMLIL